MTLSVPVPFTAVTGNFLTSALWNAQVRDAVSFLVGVPSFRAHSEVAQTLGVDNTWYSLNLEVEELDNYGGHSTSTNTSRYTCQLAGQYLITGIAAFSGATSTTGNRGTRITVNANAVRGSFVKAPAAGSTSSSALSTTVLVQLAVGDYVEVQANHNAGASITTSATNGDVAPSLVCLWVGQ